MDLQGARRQQGARALIAAEVERLADQALDYTVGMAIVNQQGRGVAPPVELKTAGRESRRSGNRGILGNDGGQSRAVQGDPVDGRQRGPRRQRVARRHGVPDERPGLAMGDLVVGAYGGGAKPVLEPAIEPAVRDGWPH